MKQDDIKELDMSVEFDEKILDDEFAGIIRDGLDEAFEADKIFVSEELIAKTLSSIKKLNAEKTAGAGDDISAAAHSEDKKITTINTSKRSKKRIWKQAAGIVAALLVVGVGIITIRGGIYQKSDSSTNTEQCFDAGTANMAVNESMTMGSDVESVTSDADYSMSGSAADEKYFVSDTSEDLEWTANMTDSSAGCEVDACIGGEGVGSYIDMGNDNGIDLGEKECFAGMNSVTLPDQTREYDILVENLSNNYEPIEIGDDFDYLQPHSTYSFMINSMGMNTVSDSIEESNSVITEDEEETEEKLLLIYEDVVLLGTASENENEELGILENAYHMNAAQISELLDKVFE